MNGQSNFKWNSIEWSKQFSVKFDRKDWACLSEISNNQRFFEQNSIEYHSLFWAKFDCEQSKVFEWNAIERSKHFWLILYRIIGGWSEFRLNDYFFLNKSQPNDQSFERKSIERSNHFHWTTEEFLSEIWISYQIILIERSMNLWEKLDCEQSKHFWVKFDGMLRAMKKYELIKVLLSKILPNDKDIFIEGLTHF